MPFSYTCPHCGKETLVEDRYAGQSGPCVGCGQMVTMPEIPGLGAPAPTPYAGSAYQSVQPKGMGTGGVIVIIIAVIAFLFFVGLLLLALLLPAVQAAREAARRASCSNNLRQIEIALLNYESAHNRFPPAYTVDESGKPLHSWRTLILPYMDQGHVFDQLKMDEPWDSSHNLAILENTHIPGYRCPSDPNDTGDNLTNYAMVIGPNCVSDGPTGCRRSDLVNGESNTIHVIETQASIPWYEPKDLSIGDVHNVNELDNPTGIGSDHPGVVMAAFCDGHVQTLSKDIDPDTLRAMLEGKVENEAASSNFDY